MIFDSFREIAHPNSNRSKAKMPLEMLRSPTQVRKVTAARQEFVLNAVKMGHGPSMIAAFLRRSLFGYIEDSHAQSLREFLRRRHGLPFLTVKPDTIFLPRFFPPRALECIAGILIIDWFGLVHSDVINAGRANR